MIKREIKDFLLECEGVEGYSVSAPFTLYSALCELGVTERETFGVGRPSVSKMKLSAGFFVEEELSGVKYSYIRICSLAGRCSLSLNGIHITDFDGERESYLADLGNAIVMGENSLVLEFDAPEFCDGIFSPLQILRFDNAIIDTVKLSEVEVGDEVTVKVSLTTVGNSENSRAVATLISGSGHIYYGGFINGEAQIVVKEPLLWWPKGIGVQNVYKLAVNLYGDLEVDDTAELKVGLRSAMAEEDGARLRINGQAFLPMGAVYIPEKVYLPIDARRRTAAFVTSAAMSGFNCFVVREMLPKSSFFDLCDVHGISVIYELSSPTPSDISAICAAAHHPSLVALEFVGLGDRRAEIMAKFKEIAPLVALSFKDSAPKYFGESSIPAESVLYRFVPAGERNPLSPAMEKFADGRCEEIAANLANKFLYPLSFSDFAYLSRLSQAENTKREMYLRREAFGGRGRAVFSNFSSKNLISESAVDSDAGWKAVQYYAKEFFAPIAIDARVEGAQVTFFAYNNKPTAAFGSLEYRIIDSEGNIIDKNTEEIEIEESSGKKIFTRDFTEQLSSGKNDKLIEYIFTDAAGLSFRGSALFASFKSFEFKEPNIKAEISGAERRFSITLTSEAYAGGVELSFTDTPAVFSDNCFAITTKAPVKVEVTLTELPETAKNLKKQLRIRCLNGIGRE